VQFFIPKLDISSDLSGLLEI